jgi:hypothetical protein
VAGAPTCYNCVVIGRHHHVVIDCPDPAGLAEFYSELIRPATRSA